MLQQLLHTIIISIICITWGIPFYLIFYRSRSNAGEFPNPFGKLIFLFFSGLLTLSLVSSWLLLIIPLRFDYLLWATVALLLFLFPLILKRKLLSQFRVMVAINRTTLILIPFAVTCVLLFIVLGTLLPVNLDTYIYHLQIVRWTNEYGVVPGLANLYPRFGLGSNWFSLISIFYIPQFDHQNFTFLNTTAVTWFFFWLLNNWAFHFNRRDQDQQHGRFALFYFLLIAYSLYDWQLLRDSANSTSYDFIVTALTLMCICYLAEKILFQRQESLSAFMIFAALSTIPFKLSGIFIIFLLIPYLFSFRSISVWLKVMLAGLFILTPFLIKNYIATGYPLFPSSLAFNSPDWQLPKEMASGMGDYIMNVNKFYNYQVSFVNEQEITPFNWIPYWVKSILLRHKIILVLAILSTVLFFYNPAKKVPHQKIRVFILSLFCMFAGWFFTAPDPRFGFSFILFLALFPISLFIGKYFTRNFYFIAFSIAVIPLLIYANIKARPLYEDNSLAFHTMHIEKPVSRDFNIANSLFRLTRMDTVQWLYPCAYKELPCLGEINPYVRPRGTLLNDGFYMAPIKDSSFIRNYNY
jgi:hypothetical protein